PTAANRPLRVGFVSGDLAHHPVGYLLIRLVEAIDREQIEAYCYSSRRREDDLTERFKAAAVVWRPTALVSDKDLVRMVREDDIDVLVDLSGHTNGNRLMVFAAKPAPFQMTWLGYVGTTGLSMMDGLVADRYHVPPGEEPRYVEKVLRMPDG